MNSVTYVPRDARAAGRHLRAGLAATVSDMPRLHFLRVWHSIAYLYPWLHPDGFEDRESGWPNRLRPIAAEAWRRAEVGQLADEELYPADAAWAGIYDRMDEHAKDEIQRRAELLPFGAD